LFLVHQGEGNPTQVLIIADPQILDERSYPGRSSPLRTLSRIFVEMNMRKAWRVAKRTRPHAIIFLGDIMDNGFANMHITKYVFANPSPTSLSDSRLQVLSSLTIYVTV
jgi:hypothetical protein